MSFQLTIPTVAGIAVGGSFILIVLGVTLVMLVTRAKHGRLARTNSVGERKLSGIREGHISITDDDVARMPGTIDAIQRPLRLTSGRSLYTPMSSRDTLEARDASTSLSQTRTSNQVDLKHFRAWPLPRQLQRSHARSIGKTQSSSTYPLSEKDKKVTRKVSETQETIEMVDSPGRSCFHPNAEIKLGHNSHPGTGGTSVPELIPRPLFHDQQRSITHGMITKYEYKNATAAQVATNLEDPTPQPLERSSLPRARNMYGGFGVAPMERDSPMPSQLLPALPFQVLTEGPQRIQSPAEFNTRRPSGGSLFSDHTSILFDDTSNASSRVETGRTSIEALAALNIDSTKKRLNGHHDSGLLWSTIGRQGRVSPLGAMKPTALRPQWNLQNPFRGSIHESLTRSKSSGLSMNISLRGPSNTSSSTDMRKDTFSTAGSNLRSQNSPERSRPNQSNLPPAHTGRSDTFIIYEDSKDSRSSIDILQSVSDNEKGVASSPTEITPSSVTTESPRKGEYMTLMHQKNLSMVHLRGSFHKRKKSVSVSGFSTVFPTNLQHTVEERPENSKESSPPIAVVKQGTNKDLKFRPPSVPIFNPQIAPMAQIHSPMIETEPYASPPLSLASPTNEEDNDSPNSEAYYTPTKNLVSRKPRPNRLKRVFDTSGTPWPIPNTPDPLKFKIFEQSAFEQTSVSTQQEQQVGRTPRLFSINFPDFPDPPRNRPRRHNLPNWRGSKSLIRGPRPHPWGYNNTSTRRSPSRGVSKTQGHCLEQHSPDRIVVALENAVALRRRNSEAVSEALTKGSKEHKRYLSIGSRESAIFEEKVVENVRDKENVTLKVDDEVKAPVLHLRSRIPKCPKSNVQPRWVSRFREHSKVGEMYDAEGFVSE